MSVVSAGSWTSDCSGHYSRILNTDSISNWYYELEYSQFVSLSTATFKKRQSFLLASPFRRSTS